MEPPVTVPAIHHDGVGNTPPTRIVIHSTCPHLGYPHASAAGQAASTARYFTLPASGGSAHYVVDVAGEQHCLHDDVVAWHAPPNPHSIGIEICSEGGNYPQSYTREQWLSGAVWPAVARAAARAAELCSRFEIPPVLLSTPDLLAGHHGICGHSDVSAAWHQSTHSDPGPGFPWDEFMAAVHAAHPSSESDIEEDDVGFQCIPYAWPAGGGAYKLVVPIGDASQLIGAGWFSLACDGPLDHFDVWFQADDGGIGEEHGALAKDQRGWWPLPNGTTQVVVHYQAGGPVGATIELRGK